MEATEAIQQQLLQLQQQQQQLLILHHQQQHQELLHQLRTPSPPALPSPTSQTTRDIRLQIRTLRTANWTYNQIARHLGLTKRQVQYALCTATLTPQRRSGRPPLLTPEETEELIEFISLS